MRDERLESLILDLIEQSHATHCTVVALVQMLIEQGTFKEDEAIVMEDLHNRAADVEREHLSEAWARERTRELKAAWSKLPKQ